MCAQTIIPPRQARSKNTQEKLLQALHTCLEHKFFEQITIRELSEEAGVSVGTFYRRFKDKESLLPLLYQEYGQDLRAWVNELEQRDYDSLQEVVTTMALETYSFIDSKQAVYRTLHLNARLESTLIASDPEVDRRKIYSQLRNILLRFPSKIQSEHKTCVADTMVFILISTILDKVLYPELTPAIACELNPQAFAYELPKLLLPYLTGL